MPDALVSSSTVPLVFISTGSDSLPVYIYSDLQCHLDKHEISAETCLSGDKYYRSYELFCDV